MNNKSLISILVFLFITVGLWATSPRLIIRSDDMGAFHSVNKACIDTYINGITTSVEVMPACSWFPEAVKLLNENPKLDVGIHLTATSEWETVKWRPLTYAPSLTDKNGYFYPMFRPNKNFPKQTLMEHDWKLSELEAELRAQIEIVLKNIPHASHLSGHMGLLFLTPEVTDMIRRLAQEYNILFLEDSSKHNVRKAAFNVSKESPFEEKENGFINMLNELEDGQTYLFVEHPGLDNEEMETVGHIGYENVGYDRQAITDLLKSEKVKQKIKSRGIKLINFKDL